MTSTSPTPSTPLHGLTSAQVAESRRLHGHNLITPAPRTPWYRLYLEKFADPIIIILLVATAVSLVFGLLHGDFTESVGILIAVLIATGVGFWQEYDAQKKFDAMRQDSDYEPVRVRRDGEAMEVPKDQVVVGDIVLLSAGDEVPADARVLLATDVEVSEAAMTGESVPVEKYPLDEPYGGAGFAPNMLLRGTQMEQGLAEAVVERVGDATEIGRTTRQASEETHTRTPLEEKLDQLAERINVAAFVVAGTMMIVLNVMHWDFALGHEPWTWTWATLLQEVRFVMAAVVVVIVAVPEGLPLSVTLALAFSMKTMAREKNLVKKMHACETIGAVNVIFTDKTGTLTQNHMAVADTHLGDQAEGSLLALLGVANATAEWAAHGQLLGSPTECAILRYVGRDTSLSLRREWRVEGRIPFSSQTKYMVSHIRCISTGAQMVVMKGAPEVVARLTGQGEHLPLVAAQQERGRRALSAAIVGTDNLGEIKALLEQGHTLKHCPGVRYVGSWFIEDPIRPDVPQAVKRCYGAGVDVVMMTGDNLRTAREIAHQAGMADVWAIEATQFAQAVEQGHPHRSLPNVIARCTPHDKLHILHWAQRQGYVCAMTGDGVNDSPALNHADVGIAMGSGTAVAKEAADIVLLDDAFPSIVTGIKWGRSLFKNIRNFLFLQLSINVSACLTALFGPLVGVEMPFTVTQFLWINLVMDALAAIALASEPADEGVLLEQPRPRHEFILNPPLLRAVFGFGLLVWLLCTAVLWAMHHAHELGWPVLREMNLTIFFAAYMMLNWWNMFNARVLGKHKSLLSGLGRNPRFYGIMALILVVTIVMVQLGGEVFRTQPLSASTWVLILLSTCPVALLRELWHRACG